MPKVPYDPEDARDPFMLTVGRVIRKWAEVEGMLWTFTSALLGVDQFRARIVMTSMSNGRAQRELVKVLAETYLDESLLPKFRNILKRLKTLGDQRNILAHSIMALYHDDKENIYFRDHFNYGEFGGLAFKHEPFTLNQANVLLTAICRLQAEFMDLRVAAVDKVHTSARIHREAPGDPKP